MTFILHPLNALYYPHLLSSVVPSLHASSHSHLVFAYDHFYCAVEVSLQNVIEELGTCVHRRHDLCSLLNSGFGDGGLFKIHLENVSSVSNCLAEFRKG